MTREPGSDDDVDNAGPLVHGLRLLDYAADYCARGEAIFWLRGKFPLVSKDDGGNGFHDATTDCRALVEVFKRFPGATGIGRAIPAGRFVLDKDPRKGGNESVAALEAKHGALPTTQEQLTGSDGGHLEFTTPVSVRQLTAFRPGLDTRAADKGYIVVEPSIHPVTRKSYRWIRRMMPAPAPQWLLDLVRVQHVEPRKPYVPTPYHPRILDRRRRYALAALEGEARAVAEATEGTRNDRLNKAWWRLAHFKDVLDRAEVERELLAAAVAAGLPEPEARKVLR